MAQTQAARLSNVIDLTEEDDDEDTFQQLRIAASKAEAAASRVNGHLDSRISTSSPHSYNLDPLKARNPSLGKVTSPAAAPGPHKITKADTTTSLPLLKKDAQAHSKDPKLGTVGPRRPPADAHSTTPFRDSRPKLSEPSRDGTNTAAPTLRSPRAAARSAGHAISETYDILNPLEAQQEAKNTTPKKPGRPKVDQWTPKSRSTNGAGRSDGGDCSSLPDKVQSNGRIEMAGPQFPMLGSDPSLQLKRKRSSPSLESHRDSNSAKRPALHVANAYAAVHDLEANESSARLGPVQSNHHPPKQMNTNSTSKRRHDRLAPNLDDHLPKFARQYLSTLSSAQRKALRTIFDTMIYPAVVEAREGAHGSLTEEQLDLISNRVITDIVKQEIRSAWLVTNADTRNNHKKDISQSVKTAFRQEVQDALQQLVPPSSDQQQQPSSRKYSGPSTVDTAKANTTITTGADAQRSVTSKSGAPSSARPPDLHSTAKSATITDLSGYLQKLENEALPGDLDVFKFTSPVRAQPSRPASLTSETVVLSSLDEGKRDSDLLDVDRIVYDSLNDHESDLPAALSTMPASTTAPMTAQDSLENPLDVPFPPDFDRGRFPAQRRRRANKYYNPTRSELGSSQGNKPSPSTQLSQQIPSKKPKSAALTKQVNSGEKASEELISKLLIARVASDPKVEALMVAVASEQATQLQSQEFQRLTQELQMKSKGRSQSQDRHKESESSHGSRASGGTISEARGHSIGTQVRRTVTAPTEKDQLQYLKAKANWPQSRSRTPPTREQESNSNGQCAKVSRNDEIQDPPGPDLLASDQEQDTEAFTPRSSISLELSTSIPPIQMIVDNPKEDVANQWTGQHSVSFFREMASSMVHPQEVRRHPESRSLRIASDPSLEQSVAHIILDELENTDLIDESDDESDRYFITRADQEEVLYHRNLLKRTDRVLRSSHSLDSNGQERKLTRVESKAVDPVQRPQRQVPSLLRHRELGSDTRGCRVETQRELRLRQSEQIDPWRYWKGASGDIVAAAWGPDSTTYAVGAAAHTNPEDLQYNRPCNLLLGDLTTNTLTELPEHRVDRPKPQTILNTYNARQAVYDACDPMVYETISSIAFCPITSRMYTASHDSTVKIWDTSVKQDRCLSTLYHDAKVTSIEVSAQRPGLFATASEVIENSIRIYYAGGLETNPNHVEFSSSRAKLRPDWHIHPECLRWGSTASTSHMLLAGFRQNDSDDLAQEGQLCLWNANTSQLEKVSPSSQSVLAAAWHPIYPFFATGGSPGGTLTNRFTTKTVVRTWDLRKPNGLTMEYECSAFDMQDITFHPINSHIVTAGCTDGTSFVWDYRWPDRPLHRLRHGRPIVDWDHTRGRREEVDTGVMMSLWGLEGSLFYTGSSDGMIKAWDIRRHPNDVLIRNVAQFGAGIQSGAFSPDGTNLLVGDADGGVHVLSSAPCGPRPDEDGSKDISPELPITLVRAPTGSGMAVASGDDDNVGTEGREAGIKLIETGQLKYDSIFGVSTGPWYNGPYASDAIRAQHQRDQAFSREGSINEKEAARKAHFIMIRKAKIADQYASPTAANEPPVVIMADRPNLTLFPFSAAHSLKALTASDLSFRTVPPSTGDVSYARGPDGLLYIRFPPPPVRGNTDSVEENTIPESEMVEENHWWPELGKDEIEKAIAGLSIRTNP